MDLAKSFNPAAIEHDLYRRWEAAGHFRAGFTPGKPAYCILMPPPNVTGTLHMGHGFNQTIMDTLIRWRRMMGDNVLWQPGTDHAGIATQLVVERLLEREGLTRQELGRAAFLERVWQWKNYSGGTITQQMRRLGSSADWSRERFTMDEGLSRVVLQTFVRLYREGLIYRGKRLVNWDPKLKTALSDLEVVTEEEAGFLWHIRYPFVGGPIDGVAGLTVATTRPETLFGDVAVMVHPEDPRYRSFIGAQVHLPLTERTIPVIADPLVDPTFGTGCVKVTPAHDFNDFLVGERHALPRITIFRPDATLNDVVPPPFRGLDRLVARERVVEALNAQGLLVEVRPHRVMIPRGDRSGVILEPMLTDQWFVATTRPTADGRSLQQKAIEALETGAIRFIPESWGAVYRQWLENLQDWCISRQLWWGHQIPAWYAADDLVDGGALARTGASSWSLVAKEGVSSPRLWVAHDEAEAIALAAADGYQGMLVRDPDVLDTWYSSALWPFSTLDWTPDYPTRSNPALDLYLPSSVLVTGFDIIFFWVARMVMMTTHFTGRVPFRDVYVHGLIRDAEGQKMSKSKGNVLDPIDLIDGIDLESLIAKRTFGLLNPKQAEAIAERTRREFPNGIPSFGADALRFTFLSLASPGRDIKFDLNRCEGYRNFGNKLWNAARFVLMNTAGYDLNRSAAPSLIDRWIRARFTQTVSEVHRHYTDYRFDLLARAIYEFVWDEFCDWYLELAKVHLRGQDEGVASATRRTLLTTLEATLRLAHPLIPFITEALWQAIAPVAGLQNTPSIMVAPYPIPEEGEIDPLLFAQIAELKAIITAVRSLRTQMGLNPGARLPLLVANYPTDRLALFAPYIQALARIETITPVAALPTDTLAPIAIAAGGQWLIAVTIDRTAEIARLTKAIAKLTAEIARAEAKLANPDFTTRAPASVVAEEQQRLTRARNERTQLEAQLNRLQAAG
ncbi:MAG: valine--tRNA ligase [Hydrogenophilus sp.]|nr:valine--tRNA ligase [Hydrogenophilus sp.]